MTISTTFLKDRSRRELSLRFAEEFCSRLTDKNGLKNSVHLKEIINQASSVTYGEALSNALISAIIFFLCISPFDFDETGIFRFASAINEMTKVNDMVNGPRPSPIPSPPPK